ncbi:MAG: 1-deoxy-D-xylulose-5-phosphate synthase [Candidatus Latescibacteria bacterium]|nr:1-deoxy-D-xylulose-5-phosphate synthase [Candidatus Latescibacterota bacterium]
MSLLDTIESPADLKELSTEQLEQLAWEIRERLIEVLSNTGGHLAPNLGIVELTIALHTVFDSPRDRMIWDVSHQSYVHKILTGRKENFPTIRQYKGISGYTSRDESEHDAFGAGHASTAISAASGIARARDHKGDDYHVIAIVGDGAMTGGLAFEGLNNLGASHSDVLIILNDNDMSIAPNVGAIHEHFTTAISNPLYNKVKDQIWEAISKVPAVGKPASSLGHKMEESLKNLLVPGIIFDRLGIRYFGPVDGHDIEGLVRRLRDLKNLKGPKLLHIKTKKGKGYEPAENDATSFHGTGAFDRVTGEGKKKDGPPSYTSVFGKAIVEECRRDERIVGITGAMANGTGLDYLADAIPDRFYDVGIAEAHAVCFAAGLASNGMKPVCAIYSTFLQRAFDQVVHDVALQNLNVFFCMDRSGLVGDDGPTHHGTLDLSYLRCVPNMVIMVPKDENELVNMLRTGLLYDGPIAMRYPRGEGEGVKIDHEPQELPIGAGEVLNEGSDVALLAVGRMVGFARRAVEHLSRNGIEATLVNARFVKPIDEELIGRLADEIGMIVTLEENNIRGGFGTAVLEFLSRTGRTSVPTLTLGLPDAFVTHGTIEQLMKEIELDPESISSRIESFFKEADTGLRTDRGNR